jgi:hypothetical protein
VNARTCYLWGSCLLVATLATGCAPLRGFRNTDMGMGADPNKSALSPGTLGIPPNNAANNGWAQSDTIPGGTVVAAGGALKAPLAAAPQDPPANTAAPVPTPALPQPRPLPQTNGQPMMMPPAGMPGAPPSQSSFADPRLRTNPTALGGRLQLAPYEVPADRVIELTRQLELLAAQNNALLLRIKELESQSTSREQSLKEAEREIESLIAAAVKERASLQAQIDLLQAKIKQLEEEDVKVLELVLEALKKLMERLP